VFTKKIYVEDRLDVCVIEQRMRNVSLLCDVVFETCIVIRFFLVLEFPLLTN
jgi:hypothetical protein